MLSVEQEFGSLEQKAEIIKYIEELILENKAVTCKWLSWFCGISRRAAVAVLEELAVQNGTPRPDIDTVHVLSGALTSGGNGVSVILGRDLFDTKARFADNCQQFLYSVHKKALISDPVHVFRIQHLPDLTESFSWPIDATSREHLQSDEVLRALESDVMQLFVGVKQPEEQPAVPNTRASEALHEAETESAASRPLPAPETKPQVAAADSVVKNKSRKQRLLRATSKSSNSRGAGRCDAAAPPSKKMKRIIEFSESEESESEESHKEEEPEVREPSPVSAEHGKTYVKSLTSLTSAADDGFIVTKKIVGLEESSLGDKPQAPGNVGEAAVEGVPSSKKSVVKLKQSSLKDFFRK